MHISKWLKIKLRTVTQVINHKQQTLLFISIPPKTDRNTSQCMMHRKKHKTEPCTACVFMHFKKRNF